MRTLNLSIDDLIPSVSAEALSAIANADIVIGVHAATQREHTIFGTPALESTTTLKSLTAMRVVRVNLDCDKEQLEELAKLVRRLKGLDVPRSSAKPVVRPR